MRASSSAFRHTLLLALALLSVGCNALLKSREPVGVCGDGVVQQATQEECDDGNLTDGDGCSSLCRKEVCGNGVIDTVKGVKEECDLGEFNDDGGDCTRACKKARCGDEFVKTRGTEPYEVCDDGNNLNGDGCNPQCELRGRVTVIAGATGGMGVADGVRSAARFAGVHGLAIDGTHLYLTDEGACAVRRMELATGIVETVVGQPGNCLHTQSGVGRGGAGTKATYQDIRTWLAKVGDDLYGAGTKFLFRVRQQADGAFRSDLCYEHKNGDEEFASLAANPTDPTVLYLSASSLTQSTIYSLQLPCTCDYMAAGGCKPVKLAGGFDHVTAMVVDPVANALYVGDVNVVRRLDLATKQSIVLAGGPKPDHVDGKGAAASFFGIAALALRADDGQNLYVVEQSFDKSSSQQSLSGIELKRGWGNVRHVDTQTGQVTTLAGLHGLLAPGARETDGFGPFASFVEPLSATIRGDVLFVGQEAALRAVSLEPPYNVSTAAGALINSFTYYKVQAVAAYDGSIYLSSWAGELLEVPVAQARPIKKLPLAGDCASPWGITHFIDAVTADGSVLYLADRGLSGICKVDLAGKQGTPCCSTCKHTCTRVFGGKKLEPYADWLVRGLAHDGKYLYVTDAKKSGRIIRIDPQTEETSVLTAGSGLQGPGQILYFNNYLYVTYLDSHQLLRIDPTSEATRTLGSGDAETKDGEGVEAGFCRPLSVTTDGKRLFVGEAYCDLDRSKAWNGHAIRQVDFVGETYQVTTLVGPGPEAHVVEGEGSWASVNWPAALTYDPVTRALYVADMWDNAVLKID